MNYGADMGSDKIVISSTISDDCNCPQKPITVTLADMMDIRNIPNRVAFSSDPDKVRYFGNEVSVLNAHEIDPYGLMRTYKMYIGSQQYSLPGYVIKNMIMT